MNPVHPPRRDLQRMIALLLGLSLAAAGGWLYIHLPPPAENLMDIRNLAGNLAVYLGAAGTLIVLFILLGPFTRAFRPAFWSVLATGSAGVVAAALFLNRVLATKMAIIGNLGTFWLDDDMMISLRYARNLARGAGLVWNPGELPVEGYTNPLWTLIMAVPHLLGIATAKVAGVILGLNFLGLLLTLLLGWVVGRRLGLSRMAAWLALMMIALNRWVLAWAVGGAETVLLSLLLFALALSMLLARRDRPLGWVTGLMIGLLSVVRADALLPAAWCLLIWAWLARRERAGRWAWWPALALPLAHFLWRHAYYGAWLPNTYYLRVVDVPTRPMFGAFYAVYFCTLFGAMVMLGLLAALGLRRPLARWLAALPLLMLAYCVYAGGDELPEYRFMAPYVPLLVVTGVAGLEAGLRHLLGRAWGGRGALQVAALLAILPLASLQGLLLPGQIGQFGRERGQMERDNVRIGLMLRAHTQPQALIAHSWAGAAPYFADRPALDMLGKNDVKIAHMKANPTDYQPGHNKYEPDYIYARRPDVIVAAMSGDLILDARAFATNEARKSYPGLFLLLEKPAFREDYSSQAVRTPLSLEYHGIFLRRDSRLVDPPTEWQDVSVQPWNPFSRWPHWLTGARWRED